jgi:hypothetical protein
MPDRPSEKANAVEREAQIDDIIARLERLEVEAARLRQLAARLEAARMEGSGVDRGRRVGHASDTPAVETTSSTRRNQQ